MDYAKSYFGKSLENLDYDDISNYFINEQEESERIEFKAFSNKYGNFDKNIEGVIRGICAFLNSDGGILIWGAPEGFQDLVKKIKIFKGNLSPVDKFVEKDKLISKVSDSLIPLPIGIKVVILENNNEYIYVFEIQKSIYSPHQFKNTYYARLDGQTKPAPHYLIDALFKKITYPNIEGYLGVDKVEVIHQNVMPNGIYKTFQIDIKIVLFNQSELQNEQNIFYDLFLFDGEFIGSPYHNLEKYTMGKKVYVSYNNKDNIAYFGKPIIDKHRIIINTKNISLDHNRLKIILNFGGKKSPAKISIYKIENILDEKKFHIEKPNSIISFQNENLLLSENIKSKGISKEEQVNIILGRS